MKNAPIYSTKQAAEMLRISKSTLYELIKRGKINSYKVGRSIRLSQEDIEHYLSHSRNRQEFMKKNHTEPKWMPGSAGQQQNIVISGQDLILDVLSNYMRLNGVPALRAYIGSFESLRSLYYGEVQVASAHLWASDTNAYNTPYVKRFLPGIPTKIIHLVCRTQGFYVAKGNPKNIRDWTDLARKDVTIINREKGAGSRVLLDEHLYRLKIKGREISGYENETSSHLTAASAVGRGEVDVGIGNEKISQHVTGIEFVPLQKESYDLIIKEEIWDSEAIQILMRIIRSEQFKEEFSHIGGYDTTKMGEILAET